MKSMWIVLIILLFIQGCTTQEIAESSQMIDKKSIEPVQENDIESKFNLGTLCLGIEECQKFCSTNRARCEAYCHGKELELCKTIFPPNSTDRDPQGNARCDGQGIVTFTSSPMHIEDIGFIEPIGLMIGGHITPIDHGYYTAKTWIPGSSREDATSFVDILAPAAGIVEVQSMPSEYASSSIGDYRIIIYHTCSFYTIYIHVNQISEKLKSAVGTSNSVHVEAGEIIGRAPGFDFSVHNDEITLKGFILPETYIAEPWKLHNVDIFDHFVEPIRTQLLDKNIRQKEPRGGKIDYDIDGKLVGNWFEENTNGYFGKQEYQRMSGYWSTHLAFAYDGLDPSLIIVSVGDYEGEAKQFAVKGNALDPKDIDISDGLVKYELVPFGYKTESDEEWDRRSFTKIKKAYGLDNQVAGVVLAQMLEDRKIRFEVFPNKSAAQVNSFTNKAKVYER